MPWSLSPVFRLNHKEILKEKHKSNYWKGQYRGENPPCFCQRGAVVLQYLSMFPQNATFFYNFSLAVKPVLSHVGGKRFTVPLVIAQIWISRCKQLILYGLTTRALVRFAQIERNPLAVYVAFFKIGVDSKKSINIEVLRGQFKKNVKQDGGPRGSYSIFKCSFSPLNMFKLNKYWQ